ncbi:MAG: RNA-binding cell elongation regulator Jag/EloR [Acidimicrobiia bacterium]
MEWVEVKGRTVEVAVDAALKELGLDRERADIEVIQEAEKGFLGIGSQYAIVRVKPKPRRRRRRGSQRDRDQKKPRQKRSPPAEGKEPRKPKKARPKTESKKEEAVVTEVDPQEQAQVVEGFLAGLLEALGLEGDVKTETEDDIVKADVQGEQTEALIGPRGSIMQAVHELTRTVVQRRTKHPVRLRLDIAGYVQRRREALAIYAGRLAEQVQEDGQEIMLEPMNAADRKVIHDAVSDIEGVRTYSEGEEPHRSVILAPDDSD